MTSETPFYPSHTVKSFANKQSNFHLLQPPWGVDTCTEHSLFLLKVPFPSSPCLFLWFSFLLFIFADIINPSLYLWHVMSMFTEVTGAFHLACLHFTYFLISSPLSVVPWTPFHCKKSTPVSRSIFPYFSLNLQFAFLRREISYGISVCVSDLFHSCFLGTSISRIMPQICHF